MDWGISSMFSRTRLTFGTDETALSTSLALRGAISKPVVKKARFPHLPHRLVDAIEDLELDESDSFDADSLKAIHALPAVRHLVVYNDVHYDWFTWW